jgi:hypothetical protein
MTASDGPRALAELAVEYKYWMETNIIKELSQLRSAGKALRGVYVMPSHETLQVWHGCLFLHSGIFSGACFKFVMTFPETAEGMPEVSCAPVLARMTLHQHLISSPLLAAGRVRLPVLSPAGVAQGPRRAGKNTHQAAAAAAAANAVV